MILRLDLQFFGGRGSSSGGGGEGGATGGVGASDILDTTSLVSARERQKEDVDEALSVFSDMYDEYGTQVTDIQIATMVPGSAALAYYDAGGNIAVNATYFNGAKMTASYDACVKSGFHPPRGKKTGLQAVMAHELGHKLTQDVSAKMGNDSFFGIDKASATIVQRASKATGHKSVATFRSKISGYGKKNNAEAVAEAVADVYCNGGKAKRESRAIVSVINDYLKGGK